MSMAPSPFGRILLVSSACAVEMLVCIGVHVWGWPNSLSVVRMETAVFALMNSAASSASAADDMTDFIICKMLRMTPLLIGILSSPAINMWPPAWLWAFGSDR
jgi:hypothetical protein